MILYQIRTTRSTLAETTTKKEAVRIAKRAIANKVDKQIQIFKLFNKTKEEPQEIYKQDGVISKKRIRYKNI